MHCHRNPDDDAPTPRDLVEMKSRVGKLFEEMQVCASEAAKDIEALCAEAEAQVETVWKDRKPEIVPGSALLDNVYKKYGVRYDKLRDGVALAAKIDSLEIDWELKRFFQDLSRDASDEGT